MRVSFERGVEATFYAIVFGLIAVAITMVVNARSWDQPVKPESLQVLDANLMANVDNGETIDPTLTETLEDNGFIPPPLGGDTLLPNETAFHNSKPANLLSFLHSYYFLDEDQMMTESVEFVDRDTGYIKIGYKADTIYQLTTPGKHVKYLLCLAKYIRLHPSMAVFDEDYDRMNKLVQRMFEDPLPGTKLTEEIFFDLIELNQITGEDRYLTYADYVNQVVNMRNRGEASALMEQNQSARTYSPGDLNLVMVLQFYSEHGDPLLVQSARTLFNGLMNYLYDQKAKLFYTRATFGQNANSGLNVIETYRGMETANSIYRMLQYYEVTGDQQILNVVKDIVYEMMYGDSILIDREHGLFFSKALNKGSEYKQDDKRADINLRLYGALMQYYQYDDSDEYHMFMREIYSIVDEVVYNKTYNGFFTRYAPNWQPQIDRGSYRLSITDALIGTQVFLDNQEVTSRPRTFTE